MGLSYMDRQMLEQLPPETGKPWRGRGQKLTASERMQIYRLRKAGILPPASKIHPDLLANTIEDPATGCRVWTRARNASGYGHFKRNGKMVYAHRESLEGKLGRPIAPGMVAAHSCDNPPCINPEHLSEATQAENRNEFYARRPGEPF